MMYRSPKDAKKRKEWWARHKDKVWSEHRRVIRRLRASSRSNNDYSACVSLEGDADSCLRRVKKRRRHQNDVLYEV